jgi:2',3'-cyclic-nucleotide 2'-phosphodiesterase
MSSKSDKKIKVLFIGDIVARPGRKAVEAILPELKSSEKIDLVIANAENLAGGKGVTRETLMEMMNAGVDYFTSGNHVFHQEGWQEILDDPDNGIIRPLNYVSSVAGRGWLEVEINGVPIILANLQGVTHMGTAVANPFTAIDEFLQNPLIKNSIVLLDFHAEVTSEKRAMGFHVDGRVNAIVGTHTHVPTADLQVLPKGTLYVSDLGMVGTKDSVLGVDPATVIHRFTHSAPRRFEWLYQGEKVFNSVIVEFEINGKITNFQRLDRIIP